MLLKCRSVKIYFFIIAIFFFFFNFYSQDFFTSIRETLDSNTIKEKYFTLELKYQNQHGNFLLFYDSKNINIYILFRKDRWDIKKNILLKKIRKGWIYKVQFEYIGVIEKIPNKKDTIKKIKKKLINSNKEEPKIQLHAKSKNYIAKIVSFQPILPNQIRF